MVSLQSEVVHLSVALVANTVDSGVVLCELTSLVATRVTDGSATSLAILLGVSIHNLQFVRERCLA